jgi:uncharacterized protein
VTEVFADTSALYALLDSGDRVHRAAVTAFDRIDRGNSQLVSSSYVVLETVSLAQARLGVAAVRTWRDAFEPLLDIVWVTADLHVRALVALTSAGQRRISLTDWTSFELMRDRRISTAFAFDPHFRTQGFTLLA